MNEKTKALIDNLIGKILDLKDSKDYENFLSKLSLFHSYSFYNMCLISIQGGSQVAGFKAWEKMGRKVKKGSKAIYILAPTFYNQEKLNNETGETQTIQLIGGFRSIPVFDLTATEGKELPQMYVTSDKINLDIEQVAQLFSVQKVNYAELQYSLGGFINQYGIITLNTLRNKADMEATFIHELSHYILGHSNPESPKSKKTKDIRKSKLRA